MCSCEYSSTSGECCIKLLKLEDIWFFLTQCLLSHSDINLSWADTMLITFCFQKKDELKDTVTQWHSGNLTMCPVCQWAATIQHIQGYPGISNTTTINTVLTSGHLLKLKSGIMLINLKAVAAEPLE